MKVRTQKHYFSRFFGGPTHYFVNRKAKDRLFRRIFANDRQALLELYNALNGSSYDNPGDLQITTVENILYMSMKNDLSFILYGVLNLYEHQSSFNPNMPLRCFLYLGQQYQQLIEEMDANLYGSKLIRLPVPQCVVFYNGSREEPDEQLLKLSDAFEASDKTPCVELTVRMININYGHNMDLMKQCKRLHDYAYFVDLMQKKLDLGYSLPKAVDSAVLYCIDHDILGDFLKQNRAEVSGMLLTEYNEKKYRRLFRKEGLEEGRAEGRAEGREMGLAEGLITVLSVKGPLPSSLRQTISAQQDTDLLKQWITEAARADSIEEFERAIQK